MLRSLRLVPGHLPDSASLLQPSFAQQRKKPLLPGRYVQYDHVINNLEYEKTIFNSISNSAYRM
jgi:hypothetical protein